MLNVVQAALKVNRKTATQVIHDGFVSCRGRVLSQTHLQLRVGDEVEIDYVPQPKQQRSGKSAGRKNFEVVHDDESIVVVNKPAGLLTVPSPKREKNTLRSQVKKWLAHQGEAAEAFHG